MPPAAVPDTPNSLTADQVLECMKQLEAKAPAYSFKDRDTVRNRHHRTSVPRADKERRLETTKQLELQEYDREAAVHDIDGQWLDLRAQLNRIRMADRRKVGSKRSREEEADNCPICLQSLDNGALKTLRCGHQLHWACFTGLQNIGDQRCPTCRQCYSCVGECTACAECHRHGGHTDSCSANFEAPPVPAAVPAPPVPAAVPAAGAVALARMASQAQEEEIVGQELMDADPDYSPNSPNSPYSQTSNSSLNRHMSNLGGTS